MNSKATEIWNFWHTSEEVRQLAEGWMTQPDLEWTDDDEILYRLFNSDPDRALAIIFAIMQMTDDPKVHYNLAAGPLEDFLGLHGETYLDIIHELALQHRRLREVLDGVWQGSMPQNVWHQVETLKQSAFS